MADANKLVTEHIDVWTNAIKKRNSQGRGSSKKIELNGIKKLRELILELAVRGKLVLQDTSDEPARLLLERITAEKFLLLKNKKIKKQKPLPPISDEEKSFELPIGWEWCHLQDVSTYIQRGKGPKYDEDGRVKVISQKCVQWSGFNLDVARSVEDASLEKYQEERFLQSKDLLWNSTGTGTAGRINLLDHVDYKTLVADSHVTVIRTIFLDAGFIKNYITAPGIQQRVEPGNENSLVSGTTNQVELNTSVVMSLVLPIPPLAEQHRIVAKVDELMLLCDDLEQQTEESISAHQTLVEVLLSTLTNPIQNYSDRADTFQQNWQRITEHFDILFTTEHSIEQLKQTILQLAVMGKLVPQNSKDEPASVLLKKITKEKEQLIADKKIKKQKLLPAITNDEKPFELPLGWEWTKLGDISLIKGGFAYKSALFVDNGEHQVIRMGNIRPDYFRLNENSVFIDSKLAYSTEEYEILTGDILLTMTGTKGKRDYLYSLMVNDSDLNDRQLYLNQRLCISRPLLVDSQFVNLLLKDDRFLDYVFAKSTGTANQANVGMVVIQNWTLPLPPINEQKEIVIMANALMENCEQLKAHLSEAQITQLQLADTIVEQAVN
jgi:type I restriction enzyme S subunit